MARRRGLILPGAVAAIALLVLLPHLMGNDYWKQLLNQALIYVVIVVGYNFVTGELGELSMAQQGFFAIGAYTTAILCTTAGWPWWAGLLASIGVTGFAGVIVGIPTLRVRGHYLVMVTMGFSEIVRLVATNWGGLTGGSGGITSIPSPSIGPLHFTTKSSIYYLFLVMAVIMILIAWRVRRTKYGRAFRGIRDAELAANVMGVNTIYIKVVAFFLSAVFAGIGGNMFATSYNYISPETFGLGQTVLILAMLLIGGEGRISGAVVGAIVLTYLPELLRFAHNYYLLIYGLLIVGITLWLPGGIVGFCKHLWRVTITRLFKLPPEAAGQLDDLDTTHLFTTSLVLGRVKAEAAPAEEAGDL